eukprot:gene14648-biopygen11745
MEDTGEDKKIEEESCTDVQEGATHIAYYGPVINIASGEAPITIGNIEQGATKNTKGNTCEKGTDEPKSNSTETFPKLREKYRKECSNHEVNSLQYGIITPVETKIQDFAVNLRIRKEKNSPAADADADKNFHNEINKHMESLKDHTDTIEVEELFNMMEDDKHRIFFVGGVAGIGKSVLAKRIAYDWSCNEKYRNHFQGKESGNKLGWEIFSHYSEQLLAICKQAFKLYSSGSIIFKKTELECEDEKFIEGFLLGMKNNTGEITKYMFKHLTIMEFLASIHVYLDGKRNELLKKLLREERYEIISFVCSIEKDSLTDDDNDIVNNMMQKLGCGKRLETGLQALLYILKKLKKLDVEDELRYKLKFRFISDYLTANDMIRMKVTSKKSLKKILNNISPGFFFPWSKLTFHHDAFDRSNIINILRLAIGNEVADSEIKNAFSGIKFNIDDLREMEILDYARWINIDRVQLKNIKNFTKDQSVLVHRNVAFCGRVVFRDCKVPLFTTNANESTTRMKLKWLKCTMRIDQSEVSSAANLFGLAEGVHLVDVRVGGKEFEKIVEKVFQIEPRRLERMELGCPLGESELKHKVEAIQIKQKFADEIGCPVFVNIELEKYYPRVVVVLLTDGYEESQQCKEMMDYAKIIAVKLDNDFQPGDELNKIVRESTCICWTDETNFDTNFAKVKEEINAEFGM